MQGLVQRTRYTPSPPVCGLGGQAYGNRSGDAVEKTGVEPDVEPEPTTAAPAETANTEVAVRVTVDGTPKEYPPFLPVLGDEILVPEEVVEEVRVEGMPPFDLLSQVVTLAVAAEVAALLALREVEHDLLGVPREASALVVLNDLPAIGDKRRAIEVDDVLHGDDLNVPSEDILHPCEVGE